jgi:hypothetical protein
MEWLLSFSDMNEYRFRPVSLGTLVDTRQQDFHSQGAVFVLAGETNAVRLLRTLSEAIETSLKFFDVLKGRDFAEEVAARDVNRRAICSTILFDTGIKHLPGRVEFEQAEELLIGEGRNAHGENLRISIAELLSLSESNCFLLGEVLY